MKIKYIHSRQIFDSRGYPTLECEVTLEEGSLGRAAVPSGASTGSGEAHELRDGGPEYGGKGVSRAIDSIHSVLRPALIGVEAWDQFAIDKKLCELDGTENKSRLGANAILAVSLAVAKAMAIYEHKPLYEYIGGIINNRTYSLPMPMLNILNGGKHADSSTDIQEFMIIPIGAADFQTAMRMASETYHALGKVIAANGYSTNVGDEGGYAPVLTGGTNEALQLIEQAIQASGYRAGEDISLAMDVAASELAIEDGYRFERESKHFTSQALIGWYEELLQNHHIISIEDGLGESDWDGWRYLNKQLGDRVQLVGDDLLVTNTKILERAIEKEAANAILIKPNQIGTLSETIQAVQMAKSVGWGVIISHRSGETEDATIAHLAVGLNAGQIKTGSFARSERLSKYNELLRISEELGGGNLSNPFTK